MRGVRAAVIAALAIVSLWKCETWKNLPAALRDGAHYHVTPPVPHDFFQEWASSRNFVVGFPLYTPQRDAYLRELNANRLGFDPPPSDMTVPDMNPVNAHPPPSVLIFLPLASLTYVGAFRIWSAACALMMALTLVLLYRELRSPSGFAPASTTAQPGFAQPSSAQGRFAQVAPSRWFWAIVVTILLVSHPLREQFFNGQLNPPLLLLITGAWIATRRDRDVLAGVLLGLAAALKLFPAFLFIAPLLQRRWSTLVAGAVTIAATNVLALAVLGVAPYRDYVTTVMPALVVYQTSAYNASLVAFWKRLFDSPGIGFMPIVPWAHRPIVATVGIAATALAIVAGIVVAHLRARDRDDLDIAFGATIVGMLLLSPITWPHGFIVLLLPLVLLARRLLAGPPPPVPSARRADVRPLQAGPLGARPLTARDLTMQLVFAACLFVLTARPVWWLYRFQNWTGPFLHWAPPGGAWLVTTVALQGYALLAVFLLMLMSARRDAAQ